MIELDVGAIRRNSRKAALVSLLGGAVVIAVIVGSVIQVARLQQRRADLVAQERALLEKQAELKSSIAALELAYKTSRDRQELIDSQLAQGRFAEAQQIAEVKTPAPVSAAAAAVEKERVSVPRVYFQIRSEKQVERYRACAGALRGTYRVPAYELVSVGPTRNEVRYFRREERPQAEQLRDLTAKCLGGEPVGLQQVAGYPNVNPLHFEVWLAPS